MEKLVIIIIIVYALAILGCLIANLIVGLNIQTSSSRAADASVIAADNAVALYKNILKIEDDIHQLIEFLKNLFPHGDDS